MTSTNGTRRCTVLPSVQLVVGTHGHNISFVCTMTTPDEEATIKRKMQIYGHKLYFVEVSTLVKTRTEYQCGKNDKYEIDNDAVESLLKKFEHYHLLQIIVKERGRLQNGFGRNKLRDAIAEHSIEPSEPVCEYDNPPHGRCNNCITNRSHLLLKMVILFNLPSVLEALLGIGIPISNNAIRYMGEPLVHTAVRYGREDCLKILAKHNADLNYECPENDMPINIAIRNDDKEMVRLLLELGAEYTGPGFFTPGFITAILHQNPEIIDIFIQYGQGTEDIRCSSGCSALYYAAIADSPTIFDKLLSLGYTVDKPFTFSHNPLVKPFEKPDTTTLMGAVRHDSIHIVQRLIDLNVDINEYQYTIGRETDRQDKRTTVLHQACKLGHRICVQFLVSNKASVNSLDYASRTPIHLANDEETSDNAINSIVSLLVEHNASVNQPTEADGLTPLMCAALKDRTKTMRLLLEHGADVHPIDRDGESIFNKIYNEDKEILGHVLELFKTKAPYDPVANPPTMSNLLHHATSTGRIKTFNRTRKLLCRISKDPEQLAERDILMINDAFERGWFDCINLLLQHLDPRLKIELKQALPPDSPFGRHIDLMCIDQ